MRAFTAFLSSLCALSAAVHPSNSLGGSHAQRSLAIAAANSSLLQDFQVAPPVRFVADEANTNSTTPSGAPTEAATCEQLLVEYSFGNSYGVPFVGTNNESFHHFTPLDISDH